jgi:osmotically-inducible protein OsmY
MRLKAGILAVLAATFLASTMAVATEEPSDQTKRMDAAATVLDDAVKLSGSVVSADDRDKAVRIARSYAGDREVQDHLTIQTP